MGLGGATRSGSKYAIPVSVGLFELEKDDEKHDEFEGLFDNEGLFDQEAASVKKRSQRLG